RQLSARRLPFPGGTRSCPSTNSPDRPNTDLPESRRNCYQHLPCSVNKAVEYHMQLDEGSSAGNRQITPRSRALPPKIYVAQLTEIPSEGHFTRIYDRG